MSFYLAKAKMLLPVISQTNVASVDSVFKSVWKVCGLSPPEMIKQMSTKAFCLKHQILLYCFR